MRGTYIESLQSGSEHYDSFENLVKLAAQVCGTRSAMINFLDKKQQVTCVNVGWENKAIPLEDSICQFAIGKEGVVQFEDTDSDVRLQEIKAVRENPDIGFYAGVSFDTPGDTLGGTLCVIDDKPGKLEEHQRFALETLAEEVQSRLELIESRDQIVKQNRMKEKTARFLNNSADILLLLDAGTLGIVEVHSDVNEKLGYRASDLEGKRVTEYFRNPSLESKLETWATGNQPKRYSFEVKFRRKSDDPIPMLMTVTKQGEYIYLTGRDISRRKAAEQKLRREKALSEGIIDNLPGLFCLIDPDGNIIKWNRNLETLTGYSDHEILQNSFETFLARDSHQLATRKLAQVFRQKSARTEVIIVTRDGNRKSFQISGFRYQVEDKTYAVVIGLDTSDKKNMLNQLEEKEERLSQALKRLEDAQHIANLGSWEWDIVEDDLYWSDETYEILQINRDKNPSLKLILEKIHPDDKKKFTAIINDILNGRQVPDWQHDLILQDKTVKHLYGRAEVIFDSDGRPVKVMGTIQDITEQKKTENRLQEALEEKKTMLAEIHHRVKNNLAIISGLLEMEFENVGKGKAFNILRNSVTRIRSMAMIHEKLYRQDNYSSISFGDYVRDLIDSIQGFHQEKGKEINVKTKTDELSLTINQAIPCALILNELLTNAFKHAFNGQTNGEIEVRLHKERERIHLRVEDNGKGLDVSRVQKRRGGKGLGFTLVEVLTKQLNADYEIRNRDGTVVDVEFNYDPGKKGAGGNIISYNSGERER